MLGAFDRIHMLILLFLLLLLLLLLLLIIIIILSNLYIDLLLLIPLTCEANAFFLFYAHI